MTERSISVLRFMPENKCNKFRNKPNKLWGGSKQTLCCEADYSKQRIMMQRINPIGNNKQ